ncbi:MAG: hypothetical protein UY87_C0043G0007 [Candidatus Peribacteria bacterium GW2011_GWC2_54_8]|nr:MAG: hypothetical protein UY87_C0043G0007 [Candidatus Peribacteria bacterium GW2011_GWC2_54_8]
MGKPKKDDVKFFILHAKFFYAYIALCRRALDTLKRLTQAIKLCSGVPELIE